MSFTSLAFLIFISVFMLGWSTIFKRRESRWIFLTFSSFFFYGWWDWKFLGLLIATGFFDFALGLIIDRQKNEWARKILLAFSVIVNLTVLGLFKYLFFFAKSVDEFGRYWGVETSLSSVIPSAFLTLPIGISFYTFESLSYTADVYRRHIKPTANIFQYFAFLSMFPRLVAGPIERPANLLPQMLSNKEPSSVMIWKGFSLVVSGYFKKVVIADNLAPFVNEAFAYQGSLTGFSWWLTMISFSVQIYCDFSGYSDIARGIANFLGFDFKLNFNSPYIARGFSDFWLRWHISLSSWFRDYVYIPMGGNKGSKIRGHINMWITMLLSGLWHGANWTFLTWGATHAFYLSIEREFRWTKKLESITGGRVVVVVLTFILTTVAWVFFRAETIGQSFKILKSMFLNGDGTLMVSQKQILLITLALAPQWIEMIRAKSQVEYYYPGIFIKTGMAIMIVLCIFARGPGSTFIYFQF